MKRSTRRIIALAAAAGLAITACGSDNDATTTEDTTAPEEVTVDTAADLNECPKCQGEIRKVYSNVGVTFKGSGFYINDSAKPSKGSES